MTGEPVKKKLTAHRYEHLCPVHGWETCSGWGKGDAHICSKAKRDFPPTRADIFTAAMREVFLDGREPMEVQGP